MAIQTFNNPVTQANQKQTELRSQQINKIMDKVLPSEATRSRKVGKEFMSNYYNLALTGIDKMFHVDEDGDLSLAKDPATGLPLTQPFPSVKDALQDFTNRSNRARVPVNQQEFMAMYGQAKSIYDKMLKGKLESALARGFTQEDIQNALHDDANYMIANYINDNSMTVTGQLADGTMDYGFDMFTAKKDMEASGFASLLKKGITPAALGFIGKKVSESEAGQKWKYGSADKKKLSKWGIKAGPKAGEVKWLKKGPKGAVGKFIKSASTVIGPKLAGKLALKIASAPFKAALPIAGWAWLAYDIYDIVGGDQGLYDQIKAMWWAEHQNYKTDF